MGRAFRPSVDADPPGRPIAARVWAPALGALLGVVALGAVAWAIVQSFDRPPDYVEGCILFNASRLRDGLALYVDPVVGAHEYGEPPARTFVAYTPLYAGIVAAVPSSVALTFGRLVGFLAWYGAIVRCVATAPREHRRVGVVAALFVASMFHFARWGACAKPDAVALLLASIAFTRALDRGHPDARCGALFALAALVKPSVFGIAVGVLGGSLVASRGRRWQPAAAAAAVLVAVLATLQAASRGLALGQLSAALGLVFDARVLVENLLSRGPFLVGFVAAAVLAASQAERAAPARIALAGLASTILVASIGFGKLGAASNYLMEPALASLVVLSRFAIRLPRPRLAQLALSAALVTTFTWATNANVRSLARELSSLGSSRRALERVRARCRERPGDIVVSTDPGIELFVNGRLHTHHLELWNEVQRGRFPERLWATDVRHANVRCFVAWTGDDPPPHPAGLFPGAVEEALRERFLPPVVDTGYAIYAARER